jgi:hypothetical protein
LGLWSAFALHNRLDAVDIKSVLKFVFVVVVVVVVVVAQSFGFVCCVTAGVVDDLLRLMCKTGLSPIFCLPEDGDSECPKCSSVSKCPKCISVSKRPKCSSVSKCPKCSSISKCPKCSSISNFMFKIL